MKSIITKIERSDRHKNITIDLPEFKETPEGQTIIHCHYVASPIYVNGGWVNIFPTTYLVNTDTRESLQMISAINVPMSPAKFFFKSSGELKKFALLFPPIPDHWVRFNFIEHSGSGSGFSASNITRNESGIYHLQLR